MATPLDSVVVEFNQGADSLLIARKSKVNSASSTKGSQRRSSFSNAIGKRAEKIVYRFLLNDLPADQRESLRWVSEEGETPGWDIEYFGNDRAINAIEVKGTQGSAFLNVELTGNEWKAAEDLRDRYSLFLVSRCMGARPVVEVIQNPYGLSLQGELAAMPLSWRIERIAK